MRLELSEADLEKVLGAFQAQQLRAQPDSNEFLAGDVDRKLAQVLPRVIIAKIMEMTPLGWSATKVEMAFSLSGKLLGCGAEGEVTVEFAPQSKGSTDGMGAKAGNA